MFSDGTPPENALSRDHALGILEYTAHHGALPDGVDIMRARPPYRSLWPIEYVPDALIDTYTNRRGGIEGPDDIAGSTVNRGDFAQYVVEAHRQRVEPGASGHDAPSNRPRHVPVLGAKISKRGPPPAQLRSLCRIRASQRHGGTQGPSSCEDGPETATLRDAEHSLRSMMTDEHWEDFRARAKDMVQHPRLGWDYPETSRVLQRVLGATMDL